MVRVWGEAITIEMVWGKNILVTTEMVEEWVTVEQKTVK